MDRRSNAVLLLPLLAALALFYPVTSRPPIMSLSQLPAREEAPQAAPTGYAAKSPSKDEEFRVGRNLVRYYLGLPTDEKAALEPNDAPSHTQIEFLIATLPDPVDSGLPHIFDRNLGSLQSALQIAGYLPTGRFRLPWQDCLLGRTSTAGGAGEDGSPLVSGADKVKSEKKDDKQKACEQERPFLRKPGVILYAKSDQSGLLLLYLIGETPISGIHKLALRTALDEMGWFCGWQQAERHKEEAPLLRAVHPGENCGKVRVLGPTFSGSGQSLDTALSSWLKSLNSLHDVLPGIRMVSGSATALADSTRDSCDAVIAIDPTGKFPKIRAVYGDKDSSRFRFSSMEAPDDITIGKFLNYLKQVEPNEQRLRVALLSEGGTVYGERPQEAEGEKPEADEKEQGKGFSVATAAKSTCENHAEVTNIKFPLHISQLRAASEKIRESQQQATPQVGPATQGLPLSKALEEVNQPHDTMAPLSLLDPLSSEQVMGQLLSTISDQRYRYVGILATDARDTMFLAQELRDHSPSSVLFSFDPDLLFLHPEVNSSLRGMLVVTTYPLFTPNLLWSPPHPRLKVPHTLMQFPDQGSEGTYNAALALLGRDDQLREYGLPFEYKASQPPLWITVVGRNRIWPLQVYDLSGTPAERYMNTGDQDQKPQVSALVASRDDTTIENNQEKETWFSGIYSAGSMIFFAVLSLLSVVFCLPLSTRLRASEKERQTPSPWLGGAWLESFLGEAASQRHRNSGELHLLAACMYLGMFLLVALAALAGPSFVMRRLEVSFSSHWGTWAVLAFCMVSVVVVLVAGGAILVSLRRGGRSDSARQTDKTGDDWKLLSWGFAISVAAALCIFTAWLSGRWLAGLSADGYRSSFFASLRALDLLGGVSPLAPLLLVFTAGFLWALSSFRRLRQLEGFEDASGFLCGTGPLGEISKLERQVRSHLRRPGLQLPGAIVIVLATLCSVMYLFGFRLVISFEDRAFYLLVGLSFFAVYLALWLNVLRFCCVWQKLRQLLRHLDCAPLRAYARFQSSFPSAHKIDLASPRPTLAPLAYSVDQARTICLQARGLLQAAVGEEARWALAAIKSQNKETRRSTAELKRQWEVSLPGVREWAPEQVALQRLGSDEMTNLVDEAGSRLASAQAADVKGDWRLSLTEQVQAQETLAKVAGKVTLAATDAWWEQLHSSPGKAKAVKQRPEDEVFRLGEDFLVGRVANFLAYVLPQMQNLIVTSVAGLLLMLFAVSSYPFQPHELLLLFNWAVILSFVGIAMWIFVQMNRDPVLSTLNGTKAGRISWDWNFAVRIFIYGIVPILALLGAQFPQSVGQVLSHFAPSDAMH